MRLAELKINILYLASQTISEILMVLPFSAFLAVWISSATGGYRVLQLLLQSIIVFIVVTLLIIIKPYLIWKSLGRERLLTSLMIAYIVFTTLFGVYAYERHRVNLTALLFSMVISLRFFVLFLVIFVLRQQISWKPKWPKLLLLPAVPIVIFGLIQVFLPNDYLSHFGYSSSTILPYQYVNNDPSYLRIQSTLRGANPFGAYLVIIISTVVTLYLFRKKYRGFLVPFGILSFIALFYTYSRSALLGAFLSVAMLTWWHAKFFQDKHVKKVTAAIVGTALVATLIVGYSIKGSHFTQSVILHTNSISKSSQSSNDARSTYIRQGLKDIANEPFGRGPGTAGPASSHNNHPARISENYFIQVGQEVGIVGLIMFLAIYGYVAYKLWQLKEEPLALMALGSLIGITFINMLSHAWTDETLSLLWWGLAGIALVPNVSKRYRSDIQNKKRKQYAKAKKAATT